jgi:hypothetical protein
MLAWLLIPAWALARPALGPAVLSTLLWGLKDGKYSIVSNLQPRTLDAAPYVLTASATEGDAQVTIQEGHFGDLKQSWLIQDTGKGSYTITSVANGRHIYVANGNGNQVKFSPKGEAPSEYSEWTLAGPDTRYAIRPVHDNGQNLNVFGNNGNYASGNPVGTWGWGDGQPNETWHFDAPY